VIDYPGTVYTIAGGIDIAGDIVGQCADSAGVVHWPSPQDFGDLKDPNFLSR